jgi:hypothetical protein
MTIGDTKYGTVQRSSLLILRAVQYSRKCHLSKIRIIKFNLTVEANAVAHFTSHSGLCHEKKIAETTANTKIIIYNSRNNNSYSMRYT